MVPSSSSGIVMRQIGHSSLGGGVFNRVTMHLSQFMQMKYYNIRCIILYPLLHTGCNNAYVDDGVSSAVDGTSLAGDCLFYNPIPNSVSFSLLPLYLCAIPPISITPSSVHFLISDNTKEVFEVIHIHIHHLRISNRRSAVISRG